MNQQDIQHKPVQKGEEPALNLAEAQIGRQGLSAADAKKTLLERFGVPADYLGEREVSPGDDVLLGQILTQLSPEGRKDLLRMAQANELSDWKTQRPNHLCAPYERRLVELLSV